MITKENYKDFICSEYGCTKEPKSGHIFCTHHLNVFSLEAHPDAIRFKKEAELKR